MRWSLARHALPLLTAALAAAACNGASFTPASQIKSLRVLAVQKQPAYPAPNQSADLRLLYWDGRERASSPPIQVCFFNCFNPEADLYYNCFSQIARGPSDAGAPMLPTCVTVAPGSGDDAGAGSAMDAAAAIDAAAADSGTTSDGGGSLPPDVGHQVPYSIQLPADIISSRPPPPSGDPYGLAYVLYTVCAGHIALRRPTSPNDLPIQCVDDDGKVVGADDFVPGYTKLYTYDHRTNANPTILGLSFRTDSIFNNFDADDSTVPTAPACLTGDCEIDVKVDVPSDVAEVDPGSSDINGNVLREGVWVDFYANKGDFTKITRLISDPTTGFNDDNATKFKVPAEAGPVHIWAVVHDNRGGVTWAEGKILVTP